MCFVETQYFASLYFSFKDAMYRVSTLKSILNVEGEPAWTDDPIKRYPVRKHLS
jgi:hypothetical protein